MRYVVYTDGAYSKDKNISGCSYLILTDREYISSDSVRVEGIKSATHAETISVALAAAYLLDNVKLHKDDYVEFNIDCLATIKFYITYYKANGKLPTNVKQVVNSMRVVKMLSQKCKVNFTKVKAHKNVLTPNTFVDRLAKIAIRRE